MSDERYPHEKIAAATKRKARVTVLPTALNARVVHKSTPTKLCMDRKIARAPGQCVVRDHL